jgi:hypothetical protein
LWIPVGQAWPQELPEELRLSLLPQLEQLVKYATRTVRDAFQLSFTPGICLTLVETEPGTALQVGSSTWLDRSIAIGLPVSGARLSRKPTEFLITSLAHEYSEALLIFPDVLGC